MNIINYNIHVQTWQIEVGGWLTTVYSTIMRCLLTGSCHQHTDTDMKVQL